jgi:uncharacterized protein
MKFILLVIAVLALVYLVRGSLRRMQAPPESSRTKGGGRDPEPQQMLSCAQCGIHLPRDEALPGRGGVFCGAPHRAAFEAAHPTT